MEELYRRQEKLHQQWQRRTELSPDVLKRFHQDLREFIAKNEGLPFTKNAEYRILKRYRDELGPSED